MVKITMQLSRIAVTTHQILKDSFLHVHKLWAGHLHCTLPLASTQPFYRGFSHASENTSNPFFEKYKDKIKHMQDTNPEEYEEKMKELAKRLNPQAATVNSKQSEDSTDGSSNPVKVVRPSEKARAGVGMTRTQSLDAIMKVELLKDKTTEEITQIWNQYHSDKDCIFTVLKDHEFLNLVEKSEECPVFVFPIRRNDGYEMILTQFDRHDVYFTPLAMFQLVKEESPPCLTLNHYIELIDDKGIVLMKGQYDDKVLSSSQAVSLVQQMSMFYGKDSKFYHQVYKFNHKPETFDYNELIEIFKTLPQYDMQ